MLQMFTNVNNIFLNKVTDVNIILFTFVNMNERISLILKYKNINAAKFADEIDVQRSGISHILSGRNKPSLDLIQKIFKKYPEISPEWLISGKGAMLKNPDLFQEVDTSINDSKEVKKKESEETLLSETENTVNDILDIKKQEKATPKTEVLKKDEVKNTSKKIEKILVFYTDNTFKEYLPE